jgi:3-methyladenine DNA glycosylase/8-oxoguanine DNA glycosylase
MSETRKSFRPALLLGRSLFPVTALVVIVGALAWGPWASLALGYVWWRVVARVA